MEQVNESINECMATAKEEIGQIGANEETGDLDMDAQFVQVSEKLNQLKVDIEQIFNDKHE